MIVDVFFAEKKGRKRIAEYFLFVPEQKEKKEQNICHVFVTRKCGKSFFLQSRLHVLLLRAKLGRIGLAVRGVVFAEKQNFCCPTAVDTPRRYLFYDWAGDGHTLVSFSQLANWDSCPSWWVDKRSNSFLLPTRHGWLGLAGSFDFIDFVVFCFASCCASFRTNDSVDWVAAMCCFSFLFSPFEFVLFFFTRNRSVLLFVLCLFWPLFFPVFWTQSRILQVCPRTQPVVACF